MKTALVLAGGGVTGTVYEIGALRAINDMLLDRTVNDFDIYIGTSAGAIISSMLVNGITAEVLMQANAGSHPDIPPLQSQDILKFSYKEMMQSGVKLPVSLANAGIKYLKNLGDMSLFDFFWSVLDALPSGFYDGSGLETYISRLLDSPGYANDFNSLEKDLYIIATDLDTGNRAVFGRGYNERVPISRAIAASTALPLFYKPVRIGDHEYVDGGLRGTASLDLAIEHGAELVICINPLVPFDNTARTARRILASEEGFLSDQGLQAIASQVTRINTHSGLHYHIKQLRRSHPEVDIILIEPRADDYMMFSDNIMQNSARLKIAQHGFESVTLDLEQDYAYLKEVLNRHGIKISRRLVIEELAAIQESGNDPEVIRRVLEARPVKCQPIRALNNSLGDLEKLLDGMTL